MNEQETARTISDINWNLISHVDAMKMLQLTWISLCEEEEDFLSANQGVLFRMLKKYKRTESKKLFKEIEES